MKKVWALAVFCLAVVAIALVFEHSATAQESADTRVFELRTYYTHPGKMPDLHKRFRDHTTKLFEKHGMTNIGYWTPVDGEDAENTLVYLIAHKSRDAAKASWGAFVRDPDWQAAQKASEAAGPIVRKLESRYLSPTDYSAMK